MRWFYKHNHEMRSFNNASIKIMTCERESNIHDEESNIISYERQERTVSPDKVYQAKRHPPLVKLYFVCP